MHTNSDLSQGQMSSNSFSAEAFLTVHHLQPSPICKMLPIVFKAATTAVAAGVSPTQRAWMSWASRELFGWEFFVKCLAPKASLCQHKCQCMRALSELDWVNYHPPQLENKNADIMHIWFDTVLATLIPTGVIHRPREEEDLVSDTYTYTKDTCMHSNTTSFVVSAFPPPHTIKVPIKGHYGFSTSSNHRESSSMARTLRAHRCLLCCHPKELRLIRKLYDHNYWSKLKCHNNINSEDAIIFFLSDSGKWGQVGQSEVSVCEMFILRWKVRWSDGRNPQQPIEAQLTTRGRHFPDSSSN